MKEIRNNAPALWCTGKYGRSGLESTVTVDIFGDNIGITLGCSVYVRCAHDS